ncbi:MAG: dihydrodipicolinate synthase family protein [Hyphomicrobiales bacterium]
MPISSNDRSLSGVFAPVLTPFDAGLMPDRKAYAGFCRWLLGQGAGLAIFGTNSEANSLSLAERLDLLDYLLTEGLPAARMMPGTGACALPDAAALCAAAAKAGTAAVLMLPPFYYKGVSDDGLFAFYAEAIERTGDRALRICLYHIPQVSGVPIPLGLIGRLIGRYPETVIGIKDSGGDMRHTQTMLETFPDFRVFCGSESFLTETVRLGGAGCISASANVNPSAICDAFGRATETGAAERQAELDAFRQTLEPYPMIPALKRIVAELARYPGFARVRPPLMDLDESRAQDLIGTLNAMGFAAPGLAASVSSHF